MEKEYKKLKVKWTPEMAQDLAILGTSPVFKHKIMKIKEWLMFKNRLTIPISLPDLDVVYDKPRADLPKGILFYIDSVWDESSGEVKMVTKSKPVDISPDGTVRRS